MGRSQRSRQAMRKVERFDGGPSPAKAREILHDGSVRGHKLTPKQRRFMGAMASGEARRRG